MTTDNRTNEPSETQVKLAYLAHLKAPRTRGMDVYGPMRAALVAAQDAAPQAEGVPKPCTRVVTRSAESDCALGICMNGCSHLMWVCDSCSSEGGWGGSRDKLKKWAGEHACPVLPSSTVDEDALAEVIAKSRGFGNGWEQIPPLTRGAYREIARAVAEWLKGQER